MLNKYFYKKGYTLGCQYLHLYKEISSRHYLTSIFDSSKLIKLLATMLLAEHLLEIIFNLGYKSWTIYKSHIRKINRNNWQNKRHNIIKIQYNSDLIYKRHPILLRHISIHFQNTHLNMQGGNTKTLKIAQVLKHSLIDDYCNVTGSLLPLSLMEI